MTAPAPAIVSPAAATGTTTNTTRTPPTSADIRANRREKEETNHEHHQQRNRPRPGQHGGRIREDSTRPLHHRLHPHRPPRRRTPRDKATQLTTNKKANAHAQNYTPTVTAANMLPILEAHVGPVRRLPITGADHTAFAINSSFEPIIAHFTYDPDSPLYYTVEQVATIHNGLTPTIFATPRQWFGELAHSFTADMENTKQRDYWTTLAVTGMTLTRDGPTIQPNHQHPLAQKTGSTTLRVIKNRIHLVDGHNPRPKRTPTSIILALTRDPGEIASWHAPRRPRKRRQP